MLRSISTTDALPEGSGAESGTFAGGGVGLAVGMVALLTGLACGGRALPAFGGGSVLGTAFGGTAALPGLAGGGRAHALLAFGGGSVLGTAFGGTAALPGLAEGGRAHALLAFGGGSVGTAFDGTAALPGLASGGRALLAFGVGTGFTSVCSFGFGSGGVLPGLVEALGEPAGSAFAGGGGVPQDSRGFWWCWFGHSFLLGSGRWAPCSFKG